MGVAIITGASSGFGRAITKAIYRGYPDIDEFWLVARRVDRLKQLAEELPGRRVEILPLDLTEGDSLGLFQALLNARRPVVRFLINNAGFGKLGDFASIPYREQVDMVALNCGAVAAVTDLALPYIQTGGCIINLASIAAFAPTPRMAVYAATKSFILSLSHSLREELRPKKIHVLAICPGPMETEFLPVANIPGQSKAFSRLPRVNIEHMATAALRKALQGKAVYTGHPLYRVYRVLCKLVPHQWLVRLTKM